MDSPTFYRTSFNQPALDRIPFDVLYRIIQLLSITDVARLQMVQIFSQIYAPPDLADSLIAGFEGPSKRSKNTSADMLKQNLVKSAKLARNWAPSQPKPTSTRRIEIDPREWSHDLLFGRWLMFIAGTGNEIRTIDLESAGADAKPVVLYSSDGATISHLYVLSTTSTDGHVLAFAVIKETSKTSSDTLKVLKVVGHAEGQIGFKTIHSQIINWESNFFRPTIGPRLLVIPGEKYASHFEEILCMDVVSNSVHHLPSGPQPADLRIPLHVSFIPCALYLLVLRSFLVAGNACQTTFEVFPLPSIDAIRNPSILNSSHYGECDSYIYDTHLLRDSYFDLYANDQHFTFLYGSVRNIGKAFATAFYGIAKITLCNKYSTDSILFETRELFRQPHGRNLFLRSSVDGSTRGICVSSPSLAALQFMGEGLEHDVDALDFTVTDSFEVTLSSHSIETPSVHSRAVLIGFDGLRGRMVWRTAAINASVLDVIDFA
ncbi:hypothetical protein BJ138DRAFT_1124892 [Hygrophoropsis aurantiaca]|uniref:Uncharacterized protein n=1 Tax=Hygrophoropsis aurantiaca TaxID=72124 RepID=A0ACB8AIH9_9AGAM|nr:hypothetical protein BJ138DRAFT_1124892 [Hygrophoropsis aurantiaca]